MPVPEASHSVGDYRIALEFLGEFSGKRSRWRLSWQEAAAGERPEPRPVVVALLNQ